MKSSINKANQIWNYSHLISKLLFDCPQYSVFCYTSYTSAGEDGSRCDIFFYAKGGARGTSSSTVSRSSNHWNIWDYYLIFRRQHGIYWNYLFNLKLPPVPTTPYCEHLSKFCLKLSSWCGQYILLSCRFVSFSSLKFLLIIHQSLQPPIFSSEILSKIWVNSCISE